MPAVIFHPDKGAALAPAAPADPAGITAPFQPEPAAASPLPQAPLPALAQIDDDTFLTPIKPIRRSRAPIHAPRTVGVGGIYKTPKPNLPASIFRGFDNPLSPSPDDYDETAVFMQDDNEFDLDAESALAAEAESANQLLLPPFDPTARTGGIEDHHHGSDLAEGLLSPPQIVWKRHYPPGQGTAPGPVARPDTFGSLYLATGSPAPTSTVPSTPTIEASSTAAATSATTGMEQAETHGAGADVIFNPAAAPLLAASIALSVVLGVLLVGLATCGIVKSCRRKSRHEPDDDDEGKGTPSPARTLPSIVRLPSARSSVAFSASPSFATAPSFHTAHSANDIIHMTSATSHPQSILITSRSAQSLAGSTHTRRISFVENPMPINSIEDLHRQLYAPPGWQPGMPLPLAYMQAHGYHVDEADMTDGYVYQFEQDMKSLSSAGQMSVTWSATPLDTISEEGSHCGSDETAGNLPYMQSEAEAVQAVVMQEAGEQWQQQQQQQQELPAEHAFVLPTIPSLADETLEDAMRDGLSELKSGASVTMSGETEDADVNGEDAPASRRSSTTSVHQDADSTLSTIAPGTPRASTSEPSLRSLSFHSACEDVDDEELAYGVIGGYGYACLAQRSPGGGWVVQAPPSPKTPAVQKRITIATSPTADSENGKGKGGKAKRRRRKGYKHGSWKAVYTSDGSTEQGVGYDQGRPGSRLDFRPESLMSNGEAVHSRSFDSVYGLSLPHEESVLGALLMLEENDMDARRAAFSPKSDPLDEGTNRAPMSRRVKRSKSIPTRLFGRSTSKGDIERVHDGTGATGYRSQGERNTEYFGHLKRAFRAMRTSDQRGSMHLGDEVSPAPPTFRRFSGADWDDLDELDPYYSEMELEGEALGDGEQERREGESDDETSSPAARSSRRLTHLSSHFGLSEAHFSLDDFDFPEPATHLPHIHITSH